MLILIISIFINASEAQTAQCSVKSEDLTKFSDSMTSWKKSCPKVNGIKHFLPNEEELFGNGTFDQSKFNHFHQRWSAFAQRTEPENAKLGRLTYKCKEHLKELLQAKKELGDFSNIDCDSSKKIQIQITKTEAHLKYAIDSYLQRLDSNSAASQKYSELLDIVHQYMHSHPEANLRFPATKHEL